MLLSIAAAATILTSVTKGANATWTIEVDKPTIPVSPNLYGIFFEEINCAGDGGLYAELVRNRAFEDSDKPDHWSASGDGTIAVKGEAGSRWLSIDAGSKGLELSNEGYWGIGLQAGQTYELRCRLTSAGPASIGVELKGAEAIVSGNLEVKGGPSEPSCELSPDRSEAKASLGLKFPQGHYELRMVSLFPSETFKGRENGLRPDLAGLLAEMKPSFMRFPGGCWVEGDTLDTSMRWKQTVGDLKDRRTQPNLWGYTSTNGLGYHEYLQLCEDLGATPLFVINCGMSHHGNVPMDHMDEFVQDALDAIEYANGPITSTWGALRAKNGHPAPFGLKYMEIGNENGGHPYEERYPLFYKAIKAKYPDVHLIANEWGGFPKSSPVEIVDEHYYSNPQFFYQNANRYDYYDRKGHKVYVGEYAVTEGIGNGDLRGALAEAAFMTGMERNSDVVLMCSYAPLFANLSHKTWNPDLIYFDTLRAAGTPSYYVQKLFSTNRPDHILKAELRESQPPKGDFPAGGIGVGTWGTQAEFKDIKVTQGGRVVLDSPDGSALKPESGDWRVEDGVLKQSADSTPARASWIDPSLTDYTLTLKARKTGGAEGFLISFGELDPKNYLWFNVGGWGNRQTAIEHAVDGGKSIVGRQVEGHVETGHWCDIRIAYHPNRIQCFVDGKTVLDERYPATPKVFGVAGVRDDREVILKVVNSAGTASPIQINLSGGTAAYSGTAEVLSSDNPSAENSLEAPESVRPHTVELGALGSKFTYVAPAHSLTILRLTPGARQH